MKRALCGVVAILALGCGEADAGGDPCGWIDNELGAEGDTVVTLSRESVVALANADRTPASVRVRDGQFAFRSKEPGVYELRALKLVLRGFSIGDIRVVDHALLVEGPLELRDDGAGLDLSAARDVSACAEFDGELRRATGADLGFGHVVVDDTRQSLALTLSYTADFELDDQPPVVDRFVGGARVHLTGDVLGSGEAPWVER